MAPDSKPHMSNEDCVIFVLFSVAFAALLMVPMALVFASLFAAFKQWDYNETPAVLAGFGASCVLLASAFYVVARRLGV